MSTVLAGAVLTISTITANLFGLSSLGITATTFPTMETCVSYVKSRLPDNPTTYELTVKDEPDYFDASLIKSNIINNSYISYECQKQK